MEERFQASLNKRKNGKSISQKKTRTEELWEQTLQAEVGEGGGHVRLGKVGTRRRQEGESRKKIKSRVNGFGHSRWNQRSPAGFFSS